MTGDQPLDLYVSDTTASAAAVAEVYLQSARAGWWAGDVTARIDHDGRLVVDFMSPATGLARESCALAVASRGADQIRMATLVLESLDSGVTIAWTLHCETIRELEGESARPPLRRGEAARAWRQTESDRIRLGEGTERQL